jgi:hypothetical protein
MQQQLHIVKSSHAPVHAVQALVLVPAAGRSGPTASLAVRFMLQVLGYRLQQWCAPVFIVCLHCSAAQLQHNTGKGISR